jgi:hypothetical protein
MTPECFQFWINQTMQKPVPHDEVDGMPLWIQYSSISWMGKYVG